MAAAVSQTESYTMLCLESRDGFSTAPSLYPPTDYVPPPAYSTPKSDTVAFGVTQVPLDSSYDFITRFDYFLSDSIGLSDATGYTDARTAATNDHFLSAVRKRRALDSYLEELRKTVRTLEVKPKRKKIVILFEEEFWPLFESRRLPKKFDASESQRLNRRGRGRRRNDAYRKAYNIGNDTDPFDDRECLFEGEDGKVTMPALANLDTGLKVPGGLIMSSQYAEEIGMDHDISRDFVDPCMRSISGHHTPITGILRNVRFRLKGTSVTFIREFYICDAIDGLVDIVIGASFIKDQFKLLFETVFYTFATWFSTKKEDAREKEERERREREQRFKANKREIARLQREQKLLEAQLRQSQQEGAPDSL